MHDAHRRYCVTIILLNLKLIIVVTHKYDYYFSQSMNRRFIFFDIKTKNKSFKFEKKLWSKLQCEYFLK